MMLRQLQHSLEGAKAIKRIVLTYDISCQFSKKLKERFTEEPFVSTPNISHIVDMLVPLVPKLHLDGHKSDCKYRYSLNYTKCCGRVDGEGIERAWAENKQIGSSAKEMNHGHRHEVLTAQFNDWNWMKMLNTRMLYSSFFISVCLSPWFIATYLSSQLKKNRTARDTKLAEFLQHSVNCGRENVDVWENQSTEPNLNNKGEWTSVYRHASGKCE
jgi:hypothetical protein